MTTVSSGNPHFGYISRGFSAQDRQQAFEHAQTISAFKHPEGKPIHTRVRVIEARSNESAGARRWYHVVSNNRTAGTAKQLGALQPFVDTRDEAVRRENLVGRHSYTGQAADKTVLWDSAKDTDIFKQLQCGAFRVYHPRDNAHVIHAAQIPVELAAADSSAGSSGTSRKLRPSVNRLA